MKGRCFLLNITVSESEFDLIVNSLAMVRNYYFENEERHTVACDQCMKLRDELLRQEEMQEMSMTPCFAGSALPFTRPLNPGDIYE
jgi:hypothetical protein